MTSRRSDTKKLFRKLGTCSRTYFFILDREFGHLNETDELASDPFAGGIMQSGHQCGLVFGSVMAVGAESYRRCDESDKAIGLAILATQHVMESFLKSAVSVNCKDITETDFSKKIQFAKYMIFKARSCFNLAEKWTQEAIIAAHEGLALDQASIPEHPISCASEVAKKMGATDAQMVTVAGFAGGMGLCGHACGALSAAIWMNALDWCRENPGKSPYSNTYSKNALLTFLDTTDLKFLCSEITGQRFKTIGDHTDYIRKGGCKELIKALSES